MIPFYLPVSRSGNAFHRRILRVLAMGCIVFATIPAQAATRDWSATAATPVWALGTNWDTAIAPANDLTTDIARFNKTSYLNQPNSGTTSINGIQIGNGTINTAPLTITNISLSIGANGITMFANAGAATLTAGLVKIGANQNWANNSSNLLTIASNITNDGITTPFTLTFNGSGTGGTSISGIISDGGTAGTTAVTVNTTGGTTTLSGINTYAGGTTLTSGTLQLSGLGTLGSTSGALSVNGGTLDLNGTNQGVGNFTGSGGTILNNSTGTNVTLTIGNSNGSGGNYSGVIADNTSGTGTIALTKTGTGTITLSGANTYTGATTVSAGILNIQNATGLGTTAAGTTVSSGATLQLQGGITVGAEALTISGTGASGQNGALVNVSGTNNYGGLLTLGAASTISSDGGTLNLTNAGTITGATFGLTLTGSGSGSVSSIIGTTSGTLTKSGSGTWTLSGANTYTGITTINAGSLTAAAAGALGGTSAVTVNSGGTLILSNSGTNDRIKDTATMTLNGGTFNTGGLSEHGASNNTAGIGALTLQTTSIIDMGSGTSIVAFADSHLISWSGTLKIYNWSGTQTTGSGTDQLYFGTDATGLTSTQLAEIQFFSDAGITQYGGVTTILSDGEVVPIPEPSTWLGGILALGAIGYTQRRRWCGLLRRPVIGDEPSLHRSSFGCAGR